MSLINLRHFVVLVLFLSAGWAAQGGLLNRTHGKSQKHEPIKLTEESMAVVDSGSENINWAEWEEDFKSSLEEAEPVPQKCKGKNCQFKKMKALDSSFEF